MTEYRVADADGQIIAEAEFNDSTAAYDWFKNSEVPDDALGYTLQAHHAGEWTMLETSDGGTSSHDSDDLDAPAN